MNETQLIERYLNGQLHPADQLVLEARLIIERELLAKTRWQKFTYKLIKAYGRRILKKQIAAVEMQLFTEGEHARFREEINIIFPSI